MRKFNIITLPLPLLSMCLVFSSCQAIGDIFKTGVGVGIAIVVVIVIIILFILGKAGKKS